MMRAATVIGLAICVVASVVACDSGEGEGDEDSVAEENEEFYSPFVLTGEGELEFTTISFTDVGLNQPDPGPADRLILEAIAESLAYELAGHETLSFSATVEYDREMLEPSNHLFCDRDHLYVALWRGYEPARWGYSLWSGCHERQRFEWKEIPDPFVSDDVDAVTWVEPLTESIVDSIHEAHDEECYVAQC